MILLDKISQDLFKDVENIIANREKKMKSIEEKIHELVEVYEDFRKNKLEKS